MKANAKSTKFSNLESLISEVLYKDVDIINLETLKSFLKFKLDLEDYETNKFIIHIKKITQNSNNQYTLKQIIYAVKNDGNLEATNPFENNIFSEMSKRKNYSEIDMSILCIK